jgi:hypothetical protein
VHIGCLGGDVAVLCGRENTIRPFRICGAGVVTSPKSSDAASSPISWNGTVHPDGRPPLAAASSISPKTT